MTKRQELVEKIRLRMIGRFRDDILVNEIIDLIEQDRWVSVEDELPATSKPPYTRYLVAYINRFDGVSLWPSIQYWIGDKWDMDGVTHWQPLPQSPTEKPDE